MMAHKFKVRQFVRLTHAATVRSGTNTSGSWEVVRLLPADETGEAAYRVKLGEAERAVRESEIEAA